MVETVKPSDTATRILDAAEALFVEHGFEATSMRMITQRAEVNLAAVNYHFGSKDALFQGVFARRLSPLTRLAIANLDQLERNAAVGHSPAVEAIVGSFLDASIALAQDPARGGALFVRLLSRTFIEPHPLLKESLPKQYAELSQRYSAAFAKALPQLSETELMWRIHFAFSTMFNAFAGNNVLRLFLPKNVVSARDPQLIVKYLVPYVVAGLIAPSAEDA